MRAGTALLRLSAAKRAVKKNVVPAPGSLSKVRSPPMSCASRRLIASPRPVPPYWRDVELSACMNAPKQFALLVLRDPDPGVADRHTQMDVARCVVRGRPGAPPSAGPRLRA